MHRVRLTYLTPQPLSENITHSEIAKSRVKAFQINNQLIFYRGFYFDNPPHANVINKGLLILDNKPYRTPIEQRNDRDQSFVEKYSVNLRLMDYGILYIMFILRAMEVIIAMLDITP